VAKVIGRGRILRILGIFGIIATSLLAAQAGVAYQAPPPGAAKPQATPAPQAQPAEAPITPPAAPADLVLVAARDLIGKALFLRGSYINNQLSYDSTGKVQDNPKSGDWTVAAMNVIKATRRDAGEIELEGVRVAIRYNPDAHEFQRHPIADQTTKVLIRADDLKQFRAMVAAIFSFGIDPALQRSTSLPWRHYFDPNLPWAPDALTGQTVYPFYGLPDQPKDITPPVLAHKADATITDFALHDKVKGQVQLRMVVDANGVPQHIAITRPLGYGLDEQGVNAVAKWRFTPAMRAGQPVPSAIVVNLDFN
jgi:TonB family protein